MKFAQRVFFWSGIYGIVVLAPMLFLESRIARDFPPATNHPEQYYAFVSVGLAWQIAFLLIGRDPIRYRALMLPAIVEKFLPGGAMVWLYATQRINAVTLAPFLFDLVLGVLFVLSYRRTPASPATAAA